MPSLLSFTHLFAILYPFAVTAKVQMSNGWLAETETILPGVETISDSVTTPNGYVSAPLRWYGQAFPQGPNITIVGQNFEQIFHELLRMNPNFEAFNQEQLRAQPNNNITLARRQMEKRQDSV
jgi:hypothetical protein